MTGKGKKDTGQGEKGKERKEKELPQKTLYVRNLNQSLSTNQLKRYLYLAFIPYGRILDIVANKGMNRKKLKKGLNVTGERLSQLRLNPNHMNHVNLNSVQRKLVNQSNLRGQAWIVFENVLNAKNALEGMQNELFFDSPLEIAYSINKSKATHLQEGTFRSNYLTSSTMKAYNNQNILGPLLPTAMLAPQQQQHTQKQSSFSSSSNTNAVTRTTSVSTSTVIVGNLPFTNQITTKFLQSLFERFENLQDIRLMFDRGLCFLDYTNERSAKAAIETMNGYKIDNNEIEVSLAR